MKLFVYGTLKPDQPGHRFLLEHKAVKLGPYKDAILPNHMLYDWDGLPIAVGLSDGEIGLDTFVSGALIHIDTDNTDDLLEVLDAYELGPTKSTNKRRLKRKEFLIAVDNEEETAWTYVLDEENEISALRRRIDSKPIPNGNWTMADDWVFTKVLPSAYKEAERLLTNHNSGDDRHVRILGNYFVLYSCLERLGLHLYGPRRFNHFNKKKGDRAPLQKHLKKDFFASSTTLPWFEVKQTMQVFDSDTMTRRDLKKSPPYFWATMRNNSAHQGKAPVRDYTMLLEVAISSLGDFLALVLVNLDESIGGGVSNILKEKWLVSNFNPEVNWLQNLGRAM